MLIIENKQEIVEAKAILKNIPHSYILRGRKVEFKEGDVIYIVKNCALKRTPLNKLIKSGHIKGLKKTFDINKANVIVLPDISSYSPKGNYFTYIDNCFSIQGDTPKALGRDEIFGEYGKDEIPNIKYFDRDEHYLYPHHWVNWNKEFEGRLRAKNKYSSIDLYYESKLFEEFKVKKGLFIEGTYKALDADLINRIIKGAGEPNFVLMHESNLKQIVYDTKKVLNPSSAEYNIEMALALLNSNELNKNNQAYVWNIKIFSSPPLDSNEETAIQILKEVNIEADLFEIMYFFCFKAGTRFRIVFYKYILSKNPTWVDIIPNPESSPSRYIYNTYYTYFSVIESIFVELGLATLESITTRLYEEGHLFNLTFPLELKSRDSRAELAYDNGSVNRFLYNCKLLGIYDKIDADRYKDLLTTKSLEEFALKYPETEKLLVKPETELE